MSGLGLLAISFSTIFSLCANELLAARGIGLPEASRRIIFQRLPKNAGAALLKSLSTDNANNRVQIIIKELNLGDDKWDTFEQVHRMERVATFSEISDLITRNLTHTDSRKDIYNKKIKPSKRVKQIKQSLESRDLHLYIAVRHSSTLLTVYEIITGDYPYQINYVTHIDLVQGKELLQLPQTFVVEEALARANNFPQALDNLLSLYGTDLDTFLMQLRTVKDRHYGLFSGLVAEHIETKQLNPVSLPIANIVGEGAVHISPYVEDIREITSFLLEEPNPEIQQHKNTIQLLASTELIANAINMLSDAFGSEKRGLMPQKVEQLLHDISTINVIAEVTPAPTTTKQQPALEEANDMEDTPSAAKHALTKKFTGEEHSEAITLAQLITLQRDLLNANGLSPEIKQIISTALQDLERIQKEQALAQHKHTMTRNVAPPSNRLQDEEAVEAQRYQNIEDVVAKLLEINSHFPPYIVSIKREALIKTLKKMGFVQIKNTSGSINHTKMETKDGNRVSISNHHSNERNSKLNRSILTQARNIRFMEALNRWNISKDSWKDKRVLIQLFINNKLRNTSDTKAINTLTKLDKTLERMEITLDSGVYL